jgi:hypothetical protein
MEECEPCAALDLETEWNALRYRAAARAVDFGKMEYDGFES